MGFSLGGLSNHGIGVDAFPGETRLSQSPWGARSTPGDLPTGHLAVTENLQKRWLTKLDQALELLLREHALLSSHDRVNILK